MEPLPSVSGLRYLLPEIGLLIVATFAMFAHLLHRKRGHRWAGFIALAGLAAVGLILLLSPVSPAPLFSGQLAADPFSHFFKLVFLFAGGLAIVLSFRFFDVEGSEPGEIYYLLPLTIIGMMVAVSSLDLILTYVSFELFAIPSYVLAGIFKKDRRSAEAGIKYFFLGTLSSGVMLLGMAVVFGLTGETGYGGILQGLAGAGGRGALAGMILFFATPVFYPETFIPPRLSVLYLLNPFIPFMSGYHDVLYYNVFPGWSVVLKVGLISIVTLLVGLRVFARFKKHFAEFN